MIRRATQSDLPGILAAWKEIFADGSEFLSRFFIGYPPQTHCFLNESAAGALRGFLFLLPAEIFRNGEWKQALYLYGVCTLPQFRRQGVFRDTYAQARASALKDGVAAIFSYPSDESSRAVHRSLGFLPTYEQSLLTFGRETLQRLRRLRMAPLPLRRLGFDEYLSRRNARPAELLTRLDGEFPLRDFISSDGCFLGAAEGFASVKFLGGTLVVKESDLEPRDLVYALAQRQSVERIILCLPAAKAACADSQAECRTVPTAVLDPLTLPLCEAERAFTSMLLED